MATLKFYWQSYICTMRVGSNFINTIHMCVYTWTLTLFYLLLFYFAVINVYIHVDWVRGRIKELEICVSFISLYMIQANYSIYVHTCTHVHTRTCTCRTVRSRCMVTRVLVILNVCGLSRQKIPFLLSPQNWKEEE